MYIKECRKTCKSCVNKSFAVDRAKRFLYNVMQTM